MRPPSDKVLQALIRLETTCPREYAIIQEWVSESASDEDITLRHVESDTLLKRAQGAHRILNSLGDSMSEARKMLESVRSKRAKSAANAIAGGSY